MQPGPDARLDAYEPFRGPCGMCGCPDARHRMWDALDGQARSPDGIRGTARWMGVPVAYVRDVVRAYDEARRRHIALPGRRR